MQSFRRQPPLLLLLPRLSSKRSTKASRFTWSIGHVIVDSTGIITTTDIKRDEWEANDDCL
jgi:hypothetical protein